MNPNSLLLPLSIALSVSSTIFAFAPVAPKYSVKTPLKQLNICSQRSRQTALCAQWPFNKDETKESEGKRESDSRLKLSGDTNEATLSTLSTFLPDFTSTKTLEELAAPVSGVLDDVTDGWALSYANLEPESETTPIGISFLATNLAYGIAGTLLVTQGNTFLGLLTEIACLASFGYHFSQLRFGQGGSRIVRLALLVDYFFALSAIIVGSVQLVYSHQIPTEVLFGGSLAVVSLGACWVWEEGLVYILFHSLWHLFSAYTGYMIGSLN